jgi:hypothetical protein
VLACDTIERIRDDMRRYIVTFIDPVSHFAFAVGLPSKHARHTARALEQSLSLLPHTPKVVLSDNGSEFEADFAQLLEPWPAISVIIPPGTSTRVPKVLDSYTLFELNRPLHGRFFCAIFQTNV